MPLQYLAPGDEGLILALRKMNFAQKLLIPMVVLFMYRDLTMFWEKEEHTAMLVNKVIIVAWFCCITGISYSQVSLIPQNSDAAKSWNFMLAPGISRSKEPSGTGISFVNPYYVNLRVREPYLFAFRIEASHERTGNSGWVMSKGLGFSTYSYILYNEYDKDASTGTDLSHRMDYNYIYGSLRVGKLLLRSKFSIESYVGITANFLVRAHYTYTNEFGGGESNFTNKYKPLALGWEVGSKFTYQYSGDISFQLRPSFNKIQKEYEYMPGARRMIYSFTAGIAIVKVIKK